MYSHNGFSLFCYVRGDKATEFYCIKNDFLFENYHVARNIYQRMHIIVHY